MEWLKFLFAEKDNFLRIVWASLGLRGFSDVAVLENDAGNVSNLANSDTIVGSRAIGTSLAISGSGNVISVEGDATVRDGQGSFRAASSDAITMDAERFAIWLGNQEQQSTQLKGDVLSSLLNQTDPMEARALLRDRDRRRV
ncbi:hypothetical protein [Paraburkholderia sp. BL6669N2]|uniref:hypothetical protein n=1 Tax=Paraburkholderia sp. BL6669N2 TaxID=1938807 RepID=UPI0011C01D0D|nr:hypothetical protein [Paraburkholderia sp. BL6669N2]